MACLLNHIQLIDGHEILTKHFLHVPAVPVTRSSCKPTLLDAHAQGALQLWLGVLASNRYVPQVSTATN